MEIKASSSKLKGPRGQIVWLTVDRSSSLELGCCRKVRFEEGAFQERSTWKQNLQPGFLPGNGNSRWLRRRPRCAHLPTVPECRQQ